MLAKSSKSCPSIASPIDLFSPATDKKTDVNNAGSVLLLVVVLE